MWVSLRGQVSEAYRHFKLSKTAILANLYCMNAKTFLLLAVLWSAVASVNETFEPEYPNAQFLSTARWLQSHKDDAGLVIVDVRIDKYFVGKLIPGAIRMPWRQFRYSDTAGDPYYQILDVRSREEYLGDRENLAIGSTGFGFRAQTRFRFADFRSQRQSPQGLRFVVPIIRFGKRPLQRYRNPG
jgi:hypothetical protein